MSSPPPHPDARRTTPPRNRTHYLYLAVIVAVGARHPGRAGRPGLRRAAQAARHGVRRADQDDDPAGHLLHDRARRRLGAQRRPGRQGRRPRARLLHVDVDGRAGHRPGRRQHPAPGLRPAPRPTRSPAPARPRPPRAHGSTTDFLLGIIPDLDVLLADLRRGAADPAGRAAGRLRAAGDGPLRRADPARRRAPAAAGLPRAVDDHVGRAGRRVRRDGRGRRRDRRRRAEEPGGADVRLLHHLRAVRLRASSARCSRWSPASTSSACSSTSAASSC